jgi:hypothetical protein
MQYNTNNTNPLYQTMVDLLKEYKTVYGITDYLREEKIFSEDCYIGEEYDGVIFQIPLQEWNEKTGMNIVLSKSVVHLLPRVPVLRDCIDAYGGDMVVDTDTLCVLIIGCA